MPVPPRSLVRILPAGLRSWPLHAAAASRTIEQAAQSDLPPHALMHRAGFAVARLALALRPHLQSAWIAAGPGNNGGDGLIAAAALHEAGKRVEVSLLADAAHLPPDAQDALARARAAGVPVTSDPRPARSFDLVVDALLGLGSSRAPGGLLAQAVERINALGALTLAVDLPTGLDAALGQPFGTTVVRADHTLSLLTLKPGLFTGAGREYAGQVWFDDLGAPADTSIAPDAWLCGADRSAPWRQRRAHNAHKGSFGDVLVVGGAPGMTGAVWLAAMAALRAGAGRVYVDPLGGPGTAIPGMELMCRPGMSGDLQALGHCTVVCGCGGGTAVGEVLPAVLEHAPKLVLDADALNTIAGDAVLQTSLAGRAPHGRATLLTPHPLEAARLLGATATAVQSDRMAAAQALAEQFQCAVLLKGSGSICAAPRVTPVITPTGNALLATAGTGDVLAGWTGGWWASAPATAETPTVQAHAVGVASAWWHGRAADDADAEGQRVPLTASQLIERMAALR